MLTYPTAYHPQSTYLFRCNSICSHLNFPLTGPLLDENLDVMNLPIPQSRELSVHLCGKHMSGVLYNRDIARKLIECKLKSKDFNGINVNKPLMTGLKGKSEFCSPFGPVINCFVISPLPPPPS